MPNQIDSTGLQVKTVDEVIGSLVAGFFEIYGLGVNVSQNSPDGQLIGIFAQVVVDQLELLVDIFNTFGIQTSYGQVLDQRVALNGLARKQGTFTIQDVEITVDRAITLPGLDADINNPDGSGFTVADNAGNQFILAATQVIASPGVYTFAFRAKEIGAVETIQNTITNQITVTLGVTNVNNPDAVTSIGENEETDAELKIRHDKSFNLAATGPADAIEAAIQALPLVTDAFVAENDTGSDSEGVPAHGIWTIVENGNDSDIGQAIYSKKVPGCAMKGSVSVTVSRPNGTTFIAKFDRPILENLFIRFTIIPRVTGISFDTTLLKTQLAAALKYRLNQSATIGEVIVAMLQLAPQGILTTVNVSDDGSTWVDILAPTDFQHKFVTDSSRITITT